MLQEIADRLGGTVETKVETNDSNPLWWGSEETDQTGRRERNGRRLAAILDDKRLVRMRRPLTLVQTLSHL